MIDPEPRIRAEIRAQAPCPVCQQPAFLDPPCTITDMRTGVTRVEQSINCTKCNTAHHWRPGMSRNQQAALKDKHKNGATLCRCGCGQFCRPGRPYLKGHKLNPASPAPAAIADPAPEVKLQEEEPMAVVPVQEIKTCPCRCGEPLLPGRQYAGRGCVGRARKGVPIPPDVLAKRSAAIRAGVKKHGGKPAEKPTAEIKVGPVEAEFFESKFISDPPVDGATKILTYGPEVQATAKQAFDAMVNAQFEDEAWTYRLLEDGTWEKYRPVMVVPPTPDVYLTVAELARNHDAKTLRAAANLRDMVGAQ